MVTIDMYTPPASTIHIHSSPEDHSATHSDLSPEDMLLDAQSNTSKHVQYYNNVPIYFYPNLQPKNSEDRCGKDIPAHVHCFSLL